MGEAVIVERLGYRPPLAIAELFGFLGVRAVPGVESWDGHTYRRVLDLPGGPAIVGLSPRDGFVRCELDLDDPRDAETAIGRVRGLLDLDADADVIEKVLRGDPRLAPLIAARPGLRSPGHVDGAELAVRALLGQQITVAAARTLAGRLVVAAGRPLDHPRGDLTHCFPRPSEILTLGDRPIAGPAARSQALVTMCEALVDGRVVIDIDAALDGTVDRDDVRARLVALKGIGPWTAGYISMRALKDPDVFLPTDVAVRRGLELAGITAGIAADITARSEAWRPWRSYVIHHLWATL